MQTLVFDDKPVRFPSKQVNGEPLKPLTKVLLDRRATPHFKSDPVPDEYLEAILRFTAQAPSGYNLQPWRFIVVRDEENKKHLQKAAFNQEKVAEAPVIIVAFATMDDCRNNMDEIIREDARRSGHSMEDAQKKKEIASKFLDKMDPDIWVNRHTMIAVTTMMLVAEGFGLDTAPMEGFDPQAVKETLGIPANAQVPALLAIGFAKGPEKAYGGRLPLEEILHDEHYGRPWTTLGADADSA